MENGFLCETFLLSVSFCYTADYDAFRRVHCLDPDAFGLSNAFYVLPLFGSWLCSLFGSWLYCTSICKRGRIFTQWGLRYCVYKRGKIAHNISLGRPSMTGNELTIWQCMHSVFCTCHETQSLPTDIQIAYVTAIAKAVLTACIDIMCVTVVGWKADRSVIGSPGWMTTDGVGTTRRPQEGTQVRPLRKAERQRVVSEGARGCVPI
jgi:hypothetical protein